VLQVAKVVALRFVSFVAALALAALALALPLRAEEPALKGVALVIGQSKYEHIAPLANPANDARDMAKLLTDMGFDARSVSDRDARKLSRDLERFVEDAEGADVAFIYYSGHGIESGGENWLVPVDADVSSLSNAAEALVPVSAVMEELKKTVPVTVLLLDACRTNPFPAGSMVRVTPSGSAEPIGEGGLTPVRGAAALKATADAGSVDNLGTVIGFAAEPGRPALDGTAGENSPYAAALLRHLSAMQGAEFGAVMRMVTEEVYLDTKAAQRPWVNESLRRFLYFGVAAEEPTGDEARITGERRKLLLTISALPDVKRAQIETVAAKDNVPLDSLFGVLRAMGTENIPEDPNELAKVLDAQAARLRDMFSQQQALRSDDPRIAQLTASAERALREGAIDTARDFLDDAVARVEETSDAVDEAEELIKQKRLADAAVYVQRADASALAFDYVSAAPDYAKASDLVEKWDGKLSRQYRLQEGMAYAQAGSASGSKEQHEKAIAAYEKSISMGDADIQKANRPIVLNNIALVYQEIGDHSKSADALVKAAETLRQAIALATENKDDVTSSIAQANLGNVLLKLGQRESDDSLIATAVASYREAIANRDRAADPQSWALSQMNLGVALASLSERSGDNALLDEAEAAYRLALEVYTRAEYPVEWAMAQNNLGITLTTLGVNRNQQERLVEAATAIRGALEVRTRETFPLSWAKSRLNLASVLSQTSKFDMGTADLEEAAAALQDVLTVYTRKDFPVDWAAAQNNLGSVLQALGQRAQDASRLEASASAFRAARKIYKRKDFPLDWAMTHYNLGNTLQLLGAVTGNPMRYTEAVEAYKDALREYRREVTPRQWAMAQAGMGAALHWLSNNEEGTGSLVASIAARKAALEVLSPKEMQIEWANAQNGLGMSLIMLGSRELTAKYLDEAQAAFEASLTVFTRETQPVQWAFGINNIGDVHWNRASFGGGGKPEYEKALASFELAKQAFQEAGFFVPIALTDQKIELVRQSLAKQ